MDISIATMRRSGVILLSIGAALSTSATDRDEAVGDIRGGQLTLSAPGDLYGGQKPRRGKGLSGVARGVGPRAASELPDRGEGRSGAERAVASAEGDLRGSGNVYLAPVLRGFT